MNTPLLCFVFSSLFGFALSATYLVDPLDSQLPVLARVNETFSWTFAANSFDSTDGNLTYTTSPLPAWLSFDGSTRTFSGTPALEDEGRPRVIVTARSPDPDSFISSGFNLCVTSEPLPTIDLPISEQLAGAPSAAMSSVFALQPGSALAQLTTGNPAVRVPRGWSFSVGFQEGTIASSTGSRVYYDARLANGSELPDWMKFNTHAITLDGIVPEPLGSTGPEVVSLNLVGADQEGYTALVMPFDLVVASHELSASTADLPTINVTAGSTFNVNLLSPADFTGVLVDGESIQPGNISTLAIDTSAYSWLRYDPIGRMLSGTPSANATSDTAKPSLPVTLSSVFNQTINTRVSLQLVPSYFTFPQLPALHLSPGDDFGFQLDQFYSNSTAGRRGDADVSVSYEPFESEDFVYFNGAQDTISGTIPRDFGGDHITVSFTAYSRITHSTSHANLIIFLSPSPGGRNGQMPKPTGLSVQAKRKLAMGLGITFGGIGGVLAMIGFFACCRRVARVDDSALTGEEGRMGYTEKDRRYYGFGTDQSLENKVRRSNDSQESVVEQVFVPHRNASEFTHSLDVDLNNHGQQRYQDRTYSNAGSHMTSELFSSGMMSKREFMTKVKQTVRHVGNMYTGTVRRTQRASPQRPIIGKPILLRPSGGANPDIAYPLDRQGSVANPFDDRYSVRGSTFMTGSPSTSTAGHSIPRRRADFGPPRTMAQVHFGDGKLVRQGSGASLRSERPGRALTSRPTSMRSGRSTCTTSLLSHEYYGEGLDPASAANARPRLVPFTSSTRVPVPREASLVIPTSEEAGASNNLAKTRIASQRAKIFKEPNGDDDPFVDNSRKSISADDLSMGLRYVQALGNDAGTATQRTQDAVTRYAVRTGEKFHIRIQIPVTARQLQVQQTSGLALPAFLRFDANGAKGMVEFTGTALTRDLGVMNVGIYADKECLARVVVEVIPRR